MRAGNSGRARHSMIRWTGSGLIGVVAILALVACGGGSDTPEVAGSGSKGSAGSKDPKGPGSSDGRSDQAKLVAYSKCMRANGVPKFPDPSAGGGVGLPDGVDPNAPRFKAADQKCKPLLPAQKPMSKAFHAKLLKYAQCMRGQGLPMPDPKPGEGIQVEGNNPQLDPASPKFQAAEKKCEKLLPEDGPGAEKGTEGNP